MKTVVFCFAVLLSLLTLCRQGLAQRTELITNKDNEVIFQLDFYGTDQDSDWNWSQNEIASIREAAQYWVDILKATGTMPNELDANGEVVLDNDGNPVRQPVVISLFNTSAVDYEANASASPNGYYLSQKDGFNLSLAEALMVDGVYVDTVNDGHATITVGSNLNAVNTATNPLSQSGRSQDELLTTVIHELGHALGIGTSAGPKIFDHLNGVYVSIDEYNENRDDGGVYSLRWLFPETISRYDSRLRDNNGNSPLTKPGSTEGKTIGYDETGKNASSIFDLGNPNTLEELGNPSKPTFVGKHTLELWYDQSYDSLNSAQKNKGVPIQGYTFGYDWNYPYSQFEPYTDLMWIYNPGGTLSHIDTTNSLMSWQYYRNYPGFIEIELAVMQDLGYTIERKNFFGKSYYVDGDGETRAYNSTNFTFWDYEKGAYDLTKPNEATYAIGTHLFASNLNIFQTGSTWVAGAGSAGVRIDGVHNQFTLTSNTAIYADMLILSKDDDGKVTNKTGNNIGILVAYGKDHTVTLQKGSTVRALDGIPVSFNFGVADLGDQRHSYYSTGTDETSKIYLEELNGPLVKDFNVSGEISAYLSDEKGELTTGKNVVYAKPHVVNGLGDMTVVRGEYETIDEVKYSDIARVYDDGVQYLGVTNIAGDNARVFVHPSDSCIVIVDENNTSRIWRRYQSHLDLTEKRDTVGTITRTITHGKSDSNITIVGNDITSKGFQDYEAKGDDFIVIFQDAYGVVQDWIVEDIDDYEFAFCADNRGVNHLYIMRTEEDDLYKKDQPWTKFVTAQQDQVDIPITSGAAAIYINSTAHVERINIMQGATIQGAIISDYVDPEYKKTDTGDPNYDDPAYKDRGTTITFGLKGDADGNATTQVDSGFKFVYSDNINFTDEKFERAYINDRPGVYHQVASGKGDYIYSIDLGFNYVGTGNGNYINDLARWGNYEYDDDAGEYVEVAPGTGHYRLTAISNSGRIDLEFLGGYTEFDSNKSFVSSVFIDNGATFTLSASTEMPSVIVAEKKYLNNGRISGFINNGRFSGVGGVWVGARQLLSDAENVVGVDMLENFGFTIQLGTGFYVGEETFYNYGTIAPGADDGKGVGIITVQGDLDFDKNSVYEVTIGGKSETRYAGGILPDGSFVDLNGNQYYKMDIYNENSGKTEEIDKWETKDLVRTNETAIQGTGNDLIVVSGTTKMDGTIKINMLPDSVFGNETTTHTIIQSGTFSSGSNFKNIEYDQAFFAVSDVYINPYNSHEAQIKVVRDLDFFEEHGETKNEIAVGKAIDSSLFDDARLAFSLGGKRNSAADIRDVLHQLGAAHRANSAMMNLWTPSELLFNRIGWGNGQMNTDDRGRVDWDRITRRKARMLGQSPCRQRTGSLWGDFFNTQFNAESDGNSSKYNFSRNGFMVGAEWNLTPYSAIGGIVSYADGKLKQSGDTVKSDDYMLGLYFVFTPFNEFEFKGYLGTGFQEYDFNRHVRNANIYTDSTSDVRGLYDRYIADTKGNTLNVSLELARPLMLHPTFILRPTLGIDSQFLWQNGFTENKIDDSYGSHMYALNYKRMKFDRSLLRAGFSSETSGFRGGIRMRAFYVTRIHGDDCPTSNVRFVAGGDQFGIQGVKIGKNFLNLGVGANLWLDGEKTSSFFFDYDANIYNSSRKIDVHTFSVGLLQNF